MSADLDSVLASGMVTDESLDLSRTSPHSRISVLCYCDGTVTRQGYVWKC